MENKLITGMIAAAVVVILIAGILIPALGNATDTHDTFKNEGVYRMTDNPTDYTLEYKGTTGDFYLGDTLICNRSDLPAGSWTFVSTPDYLVRLQNFSAQSYNLWIIGMDGTNRVIGDNTTESAIVEITEDTISNGSYTYTYSGAFRGIAPTGNYIMTDGTKDPVVHNTDSVIVGNGTTTVDHWYDLFYLSGTVEDMDVDAPTGITVSDVEVNASAMADYVNASKLTSVTFTASDGVDTSVDATYNRVIVPYEVTLEKAQHLTDAQIVILDVIPLLLIVAVLLGVVAVFILRRE